MAKHGERQFYLLGAPFREKNRQAYEDKFRERFSVPAGPAGATKVSEEAIEYIYRIMDRQINKGIGLLAYNALLFAALTLVGDRGIREASGLFWSKLPVDGGTLALLSCVPLLVLLWVKWPSAAVFADAGREFTGALKVLWWRTHCLTISLYLSFLATTLAVLGHVRALLMHHT